MKTTKVLDKILQQIQRKCREQEVHLSYAQELAVTQALDEMLVNISNSWSVSHLVAKNVDNETLDAAKVAGKRSVFESMITTVQEFSFEKETTEAYEDRTTWTILVIKPEKLK